MLGRLQTKIRLVRIDDTQAPLRALRQSLHLARMAILEHDIDGADRSEGLRLTRALGMLPFAFQMNLRNLPMARQNTQLRQSQQPLHRRWNRPIAIAQFAPKIVEAIQ